MCLDCVVKILEEWREQILPLHVEKWENLDDKKKTEIISINDFYCGMHFILGLQDNFESNIKEGIFKTDQHLM
jgi:hypothetical protein